MGWRGRRDFLFRESFYKIFYIFRSMWNVTAVLQMMARNYRTTRYHTIQQHYCAIILSRVNTQRQHRQGSSLCHHCFHSRYYGTVTPYWALFFLFPFFPQQCSSSPTCTKPWSSCWSHRSVLRRGWTMFKAEHTADHNREDTQGLRNDSHCKPNKGGYCVVANGVPS